MRVHEAATRAWAVLQALADLAPSGAPQASKLMIPSEWFRWLPADSVRIFGAYPDPSTQYVPIDRRFGERLAAVDQLRPGQRSLRVGWLFVAGRIVDKGGRSRRVFHPLVTVPVRVDRFAGAQLVPAGDAEVTELVTDRDRRQELDRSIELGGGALDGLTVPEIPDALLARLVRLQRFARMAAAAAGLPATRVVPAREGPESLLRSEELVIVAGAAVFAIHDTDDSSRAGSLRAWSPALLARWTAFHSLYVDLPAPGNPPEEEGPAVDSPYLLTPVQREAIRQSRSEPVTLISGAPGTGKSHAIAAIACDALARNETVLVAAKSDATVDALLDLLERAPGPDPVVFGSNQRREALAARLSGGQLQPLTREARAAAEDRLAAAAARRDALRSEIADQLRAEEMLARGRPEDEARLTAPAFFHPAADLGRAAELSVAASGGTGGWWTRRRRRKAARALVELAGSPIGTTPAQVARALDVARAGRIAADLVLRGGLDLDRAWEELLAADDVARNARGTWLAAESRSAERLNRSTLPAIAALATSLRSGRAARREQLRRLSEVDLTRALPLWVGTLADIDDLLPLVAGLFDLVILDEASSIDQPLAAPALLRGRRGVIAGDPHQLRHVSFLSDEQLRTAVAAHGLDRSPGLAARVDVRRNSTFDVAAGVAPVLLLDEHFRSDPHLVEFVARRLYGKRLHIATRSPTTESRDCITLVRTTGHRDREGVVRAEVDHALATIKQLQAQGERSIGVVTPFRAQADALEKAALQAFNADELETLDLRIGTVHAFQGNERDVIVASFGLGPDESPASWRFVEDPHLFAVFATRARKRLILLLSADPPEGGLVDTYLAQADGPPGRPEPARPVSAWVSAIAEGLEAAGLPVTVAYPTGRHTVDICLADTSRNVGIECEVHPDGPEAHIDRHLALERAGWQLPGAYRSRWEERRGELVVTLVVGLSRATTG